MGVLSQDIRYALRSFRRAPGFTFVALLTLALGIGGTTAIFSIVDGVVLRPLPYPDSDRIVRLTRAQNDALDGAYSAADYLDLVRGQTKFSHIAGYRQDILDLTGRGEPTRVAGMQTTGAFFDVLGATPLLGRTYHEATDPPGATVAVIGETIWRQQFGSDPNIVGTKIRLNGNPTEIIGVVPAAVRHPQRVDVWMLSPLVVPVSPFSAEPGVDPLSVRAVNYFTAIARVAPGATHGDAREEIGAIAARLEKEYPDSNAGQTFNAVPLAENLVSGVRSALYILFGAVGFVLLIACANVAGLLMARGTARRRELALRTALGAGRGRLMGQLLTESLVLALAGGVAGLLAGSWILTMLVRMAPANLPRLDEVSLDWRVAVFTLAATVVVGITFGLAPALAASKPQLNSDLKDGGRSGSARTTGRNILVVSQVALALVLLIGAGLMLSSLSKLRAVDPGFRTTELVAVELLLPQARYSESRQRDFYSGVLERLRANPLTAQSALLFPFPLRGSNAQADFQVIGQPQRSPTDRTAAELNMVSDNYFQTAGMRLLRGRDFSASDGPNAPPVAIVNEAALKEFGDKDPIGSEVDLGGRVTVIGIVSSARRSSLDTPPRPAVYLPYTQFGLPYMGVAVRTPQGAAAILAAVKAAAGQLDPDLPIGEVKTIEQVIDESTGQPRFRSFLVASFAVLALLLAAVGVYGLISFTVAQRVPEIGVRLALGANPWQVFRLVIGNGLRLAGTGVALGLVAAFAATRLVSGLLFNTSTTDPVIYASLSGLLLTMAALACYVPARRAMRVDPMTALRSE